MFLLLALLTFVSLPHGRILVLSTIASQSNIILRNSAMKFHCEDCGYMDKILVDGYDFGDRLLEGVMFWIICGEDGSVSSQITRSILMT